MTLERFQSLVLKLSNQMFVRYYLWINLWRSYPLDQQMLGIEFAEDKWLREPKNKRLAAELAKNGFVLNPRTSIWEVERTAEEPHEQ